MNNINKISIISLIIINSLLSVLCYHFFKINSIKFDKSQTEEFIKIKMLEQIFENTLNNDNLQIDSKTTVTSKDGEIVNIKNIIKDNPIFVLRISDLHCDECVRSILLKLVRLTHNTKFEKNIVLFASYQNKRTLSIYIDNLDIKFPVYIVDKLPLPCEDLNYPYCFMINKNGSIFHTFVPDKNQSEIANNYLEIIQEKYFK